MHVLSLPQNKFRRVFFRLFDGALETSNFRFEKARSVITLLRCFLHENTQRGKIARVKFAEELSTMSKNRLRWITLVRGPIWGIHSLTLMISCHNAKAIAHAKSSVWIKKQNCLKHEKNVSTNTLKLFYAKNGSYKQLIFEK